MHIDTQLLALLCGHFVGDFILQTDELAEKKGKFLGWVLCHALMVSATTWILLGSLSAWWIAAITLLLHFAIDCIKLRLTDRKPDCRDAAGKASHAPSQATEGKEGCQPMSDYNFHLFVGDQILHILTIVVLWLAARHTGSTAVMTNHWTILFGIQYTRNLLLLTGFAVSVWAIGVVLKYQMARFAAGMEEKVKQGLPRGGRTIGMLERVLVFVFVLAGKPEGVGFVVAAKSVFRIGELTGQQDKEHAEYIMIGTLRSFTYALVAAFITKWLMENLQ